MDDETLRASVIAAVAHGPIRRPALARRVALLERVTVTDVRRVIAIMEEADELRTARWATLPEDRFVELTRKVDITHITD